MIGVVKKKSRVQRSKDLDRRNLTKRGLSFLTRMQRAKKGGDRSEEKGFIETSWKNLGKARFMN